MFRGKVLFGHHVMKTPPGLPAKPDITFAVGKRIMQLVSMLMVRLCTPPYLAYVTSHICRNLPLVETHLWYFCMQVQLRGGCIVSWVSVSLKVP